MNALSEIISPYDQYLVAQARAEIAMKALGTFSRLAYILYWVRW